MRGVMMRRMKNSKLLTTREAAELLRVSVETVKLWARRGRIPSIKLGPNTRRFSAGDLAGFLKRRSARREPVR
jgi:excisionase family DNA binding protein